MTYKQIKLLILVTPTLTIGLWEYVRHQFLLPYLSMVIGNWLSPVIILAVTLTLLRRLFAMLERTQEELQQERSAKAVLLERERLARRLHDDIAQSLFLLSVQADKLGSQGSHALSGQLGRMRKTLQEVNGYVRQAIAELREPQDEGESGGDVWLKDVRTLLRDFERDTGITVELSWRLPEGALQEREKKELRAAIREAVTNIRKHAEAHWVAVTALVEDGGWLCRIEDDGKGFSGDPFGRQDSFGLRMIRDRATELGWLLEVKREAGKTVVSIRRRSSV